MKKTFLYTILGFMGIMGTLSMGVCGAQSLLVYSGGTYTIYTGDFSYGITIQSENLGEGYYGYYYQWGNNNGNPGDSAITTQLLDWNDNYENHGYDGPITGFIKLTWNKTSSTYNNKWYDIWNETSQGDLQTAYSNWTGNNLRGGGNDNDDSNVNIIKGYHKEDHMVTNPSARQGPCPSGYHVPSIGEWHELMMLWCNYRKDICDASAIKKGGNEYARAYYLSKQGLGTAFANTFNLRLAGDRLGTENKIYGKGENGFYWSSSPYLNQAWAINFYQYNVQPYLSYRSVGFSVRCFKDYYVKAPKKTLNLYFMANAGDTEEIGTGEVTENMTGSVPAAVTTAMSNVVNTGYIFSGSWSLSGETTAFDFENTPIPGDWADANGNVYFIAQWTPITYTIHFDGNGAEIGSMEDISATYDTNYLINVTADNWFKKVGYIYRGLYTGADISGYTNEEKQALELGQGYGIFDVRNLTTENGSVVTLYPNWGERKYKIVYNANGLNGEIANTECYYENTNCSLSNGEGFYKQGSTLIGWNLSPNGDSTGFDLGTSYSTREIVAEEADKILNGGVDTEYVNLYAVYRPSTFTIVYDGNGGEGSVDLQNITYGDGTTQLNSNSFTREGYHFAGWKGTYNGMTIQFSVNGGSINNNLISEDGSVLTLQAQWALDPDYTISYDYDGGAVDEDNPTSYNVETESFTLNRPSKQGYTFDHWEGYSQDEDVTIGQGSTGDRSFKAIYTPNEDTEYRVEHYQENIGGGYSLIDTDYEEGITAETALYTTKDYDGFELASEPLSQTIAADGSTVVRIEYNRKSYELIIINDESTVTGNVKYGEEVILDPGVKNGYSFVRWEGIENLVEDGGTYRMPIADEGLTLTAVWQIINSTPVAGGGGGRSISSSSSTLVEEHNSASEDKEQDKLEKRLESKELEKNDELKDDDKSLDDVVMSGDENSLDLVEENNDGIDNSQNKVFNHEESVKEKSPSPLTRGEVAVMTNILLEVYPQIIEGKQEVNEACSEYADEQDFTSQEKRAITKLCRHAIMGIHEEDDTPLDEFMVSENTTEEEFARIVNRVVSNYDDSSLEVVKESLNKLSESKENVVFGTVYDVFMQIKKLFD